jgi:hypothetical protein
LRPPAAVTVRQQRARFAKSHAGGYGAPTARPVCKVQ